MGKWCCHLFSVAFDPILFILAGNEDMHEISDEFELRPDQTTDSELAALERLKMGKCLHSSLFIFDRIIIKVAGNQDRHKSLVVFDRPKSVNSFWSYFPLIDENFTLLNLNISEASWPILIIVCLCWSFTAQSTTRSCRAGQLKVALFLGRLRPSKRLTSTKRGRPRQ